MTVPPWGLAPPILALSASLHAGLSLEAGAGAGDRCDIQEGVRAVIDGLRAEGTGPP